MTKRGILETVKSNGKVLPLRRVAKTAEPNEAALGKLGCLIAAYAPHDGSFALCVPGVHAIRFSRANQECVHALSLPSLCIATQGTKTFIVGQHLYEYDATRMIVVHVRIENEFDVLDPEAERPDVSDDLGRRLR